MVLKCVIIDDEPLARLCIENYVEQVDQLHLVGTGNNGVECKKLLDAHPVDLLFLDIQMPVLSGLDYLRMAPHAPMVILTTAYPEYALEGFQLDVLDYLVKPITFQRFFKAVTKAIEYYQLRTKSFAGTVNNAEPAADHFFIKCDYKYEKIFVEDILYIAAMQNYITIYTVNGKYLTLLSLKNVEAYLERSAFIRVHKSFIVSISKIGAIEHNEIVIGAHRIPISRQYREEVLGQIVNNKLWKK